MKALKVFTKPFEAPQSVKIKFNLIFISIQLSEMCGTGKFNRYFYKSFLVDVLLDLKYASAICL